MPTVSKGILCMFCARQMSTSMPSTRRSAVASEDSVCAVVLDTCAVRTATRAAFLTRSARIDSAKSTPQISRASCALLPSCIISYVVVLLNGWSSDVGSSMICVLCSPRWFFISGSGSSSAAAALLVLLEERLMCLTGRLRPSDILFLARQPKLRRRNKIGLCVYKPGCGPTLTSTQTNHTEA